MAIALAAAAIVASPASALAANDPVATRPAVHERLTSAPDAVTVAFTEPVGDVGYVVVEDSKGVEVAAEVPTIVSTNVAVDLTAPMAPGVYTVKFRVEGPRGPEGGSYQFAVGDAGKFGFDGVRQWIGYSAVPPVLALPGDDAAAAAQRTADEQSKSQPSATPTVPGSSQAPSASRSDAVDLAPASDTGFPWWTALLVGAVAVASATAMVVRRRAHGA